jgi:hypothetical protein
LIEGVTGISKSDLQKLTDYINKIVDMLKDRNVSLPEIFEFVASDRGETPKDIEYGVREQIAENYIKLVKSFEDDFDAKNTEE